MKEDFILNYMMLVYSMLEETNIHKANDSCKSYVLGRNFIISDLVLTVIPACLESFFKNDPGFIRLRRTRARMTENWRDSA
jgi:hypothetical protein